MFVKIAVVVCLVAMFDFATPASPLGLDLSKLLNLESQGYSRALLKKLGERLGLGKRPSTFGQRQSPIAIEEDKAVKVFLPNIEFIGYKNLLQFPLVLTNDGHSVTLAIPKLNKTQTRQGAFTPFIRGGKLDSDYEILGIHFHWGHQVGEGGSEHKINGVDNTAEVHMVHKNVKYATLQEALQNEDGVAVVAFFFQEGVAEAPGLQTLVSHLPLIRNPGESTAFTSTFSLASIFESVDTETFYTYKGSLTTPPFSEAVTWLVFPQPIEISQEQIREFRNLHHHAEGEHASEDNFRDVQPIGNRRVLLRSVNRYNTKREVLDRAVSYLKERWYN